MASVVDPEYLDEHIVSKVDMLYETMVMITHT